MIIITRIFLSLAIYCAAVIVASFFFGAAAQQAGMERQKDLANIVCGLHAIGLIPALAAAGIAALWGA